MSLFHKLFGRRPRRRKSPIEQNSREALWADLRVTPLEPRRVLSLTTLDTGGNLVITDDVATNDTLAIAFDDKGDGDASNDVYVISDPNNALNTDIAGANSPDQHTVEVLVTSITGTEIQVDTGAGDDSLTIDFSDGDFLAANGLTLRYEGGGQATATGDSITADGGTFASITYNVTGDGAGNFEFDGNQSIFFEDLEPATITSASGTTTIDVDDGVVGGSLSYELTDGGNPTDGMLFLDLPGSLEDLTFAVPSVELIINGDVDADDSFTISSVDTGNGPAVTVDMGGDTGAGDTVTLDAALSLASGKSLTVTSEVTNLNNSITTDGGSIQFNGSVTVNGDTTLDTGTGAGDINLNGIVTGGNNDLQLISGSGTITANAALNGIGELKLQENVATSTGAVVLNDNVSANTLTTFAQPYIVSLLGSSTTITSDTTFNNTGGVTIGNSSTTDTFTGNVVIADEVTLRGDSNIVGDLRVNDGGLIAPGNSVGKFDITGNLTLDPGATFEAEFDSATQHDQISVNGTVDLEGAILDLDVNFSPAAGTPIDITLIDNDGVDAISGTLDGLPDGMVDGFTDGSPDNLFDGALFVNGDFVGRIEYTRGNGNDVTIFSKTVTVDNPSGSNYTLSRSGDNLEFAISGGSNTSTELIDLSGSVSLTQYVINGGTGEDNLTVDYGTDAFFPILVTFNGGGGQNTLTLTNTPVIDTGNVIETINTITYSSLNSLNDGTIDVIEDQSTGAISNGKVHYTGLETSNTPINDEITATNRVFSFTGGQETITLSDNLITADPQNPPASDSITSISSDVAGGVNFLNPADGGSLTVETRLGGGTGPDTIDVGVLVPVMAPLDPAFDANLTINGHVDDIINLNGTLSVGAGSLEFNGQAINFNADEVNSGGGQTYNALGTINTTSLTFNDEVTFSDDLNVTSGSGDDVTITFNGTVNAAGSTFQGGDGNETFGFIGRSSNIDTVNVGELDGAAGNDNFFFYRNELVEIGDVKGGAGNDDFVFGFRGFLFFGGELKDAGQGTDGFRDFGTTDGNGTVTIKNSIGESEDDGIDRFVFHENENLEIQGGIDLGGGADLVDVLSNAQSVTIPGDVSGGEGDDVFIFELDASAITTFSGEFNGGAGEDELILRNSESVFNGDVGIESIFAHEASTFNENVSVDTLDVTFGPHAISFLGSSTEATNDTTFQNSGGVTIGNDANGDTYFGNVIIAGGVTLNGESNIVGDLTIQTGGVVSPGNSGGIFNLTGNLTLESGATFEAEIMGATPGVQHDQINVTGTVSLGGATLNASGSITSSPGQEIVLIENDDSDSIVGTLVDGASNTINEGDTVAINGISFFLSYEGGDGNDLTLTEFNDVNLISGNLVVSDALPDTNDSLTLAFDDKGDGDASNDVIVITNPGVVLTTNIASATVSANMESIEVLVSSITGTEIQVNTGDGDDSLTIDFSGGDFLAANGLTLLYDGGGQATATGDSITVDGGTFTSITYNVTGDGAGNFEFDGNQSIFFEDLEPATITSASGTTTIDVDDGFVGGSLSYELTDGGNPTDGMLFLDLPGSLEDLTFAVPTSALIINGDVDAADTLTITSVDNGTGPSVSFNGQGGSDTLNVNTVLDLDGDVAATAEAINLNNATVSTTGDQTYNGPVLLSANVIFTANDITFNGTVDSVGTGGFAAPPSSPFAAGSFPISVGVGDFDGINGLDLAVANQNSNDVTILLNDGNGGFTPAGTPLVVGVSPVSVAVGDFDGVNGPDLAVANANDNNVTVLLNSGSGSFTAAGSPVSVGSLPVSVAVGDFDGINGLDLAVANHNSNNVTVLLNNGSGSFTAGSSLVVGTSPRSVAVGDFDGVNGLDLAVANEFSNDVTVLLNNGTGGFSASTFAAGTQPFSVAVGDFDGTNGPDLAVANHTTNSVTVLLNNGAGNFSPAAGSPLAVGTTPRSVTVGDFDGINGLDLAIGNDDSDDVTVLLNDGSGNFAPVSGSPIAVGTSPRSIAVGDFDVMNGLDLAVANSDSNNVSVLLNQPQTLTINTTGSGVTTFGDTVGGVTPLASLTTNSDGTTQIGGNINTSGGTQIYNNPVVLTADTVLTDTGATGIFFNNTVDSDAPGTPRDLTVVTTNAAAEIEFNGAVGGTNDLDELTVTNAGLLDINAGADFDLDGLFLQNGAGVVETAGSITTTGASITFNQAVTLTDNSVTFDTGSGNIVFNDTLDGGQNLTLNAGTGTTTFTSDVGSTTAIGTGTGAALNINSAGTTEFQSSLAAASGITQANTAGTITFRDNVNVAAGNVGSNFNADVVFDGLTFDADGTVIFGDALSDLLTISGALTTIDATTNNSTVGINALTLNSDLTVNAGSGAIGIAGEIKGNNNLLLNTTGSVFVHGSVTAAMALASFTVTGAAQVDLADVIASGDIAVEGTNIKLIDDTYQSTGGNVTFTGPVILDANNVQMNVTSGGGAGDTITFTAAIDDPDNDENLNLVGGAGTIRLQGDVGTGSALGSITTNGTTEIGGNITTSGDTQTFNGPVVLTTDAILTDTGTAATSGIFFNDTVDGDGNGPHDLTAITTNANATIQFGDGTGTDTIGGTNPLDVLTIDNAGTATIGTVLAGTGTQLVKEGDGPLTVSGINTFTGVTNVSDGTLAISSATGLGANGSGAAASGTVVANGATLELQGTFAVGLTIGDEALSIQGTGHTGEGALRIVNESVEYQGDVTLTGDTLIEVAIGSSGALRLLGDVQDDALGPHNLTLHGGNVGGIISLRGTNTFGGDVFVDEQAELEVRNGSAVPDGSDVNLGANTRFQLFGSDETVARVISSQATALILLGSHTLTVGGSSATPEFAGFITGTGGLTKNGTDVFSLSGANTYDGTTTINGGTLRVNGSIDGASGTIEVNSGGTLDGTGSIGTTVNANSGGTVTAGNSPGILTINGNQNFLTGSTFAVEVADVNASGATAGVDHDQLVVNGMVTINTTSTTLDIDTTGSTNVAAGDAYIILANDGTDAITGEFAGLIVDGTTVTTGDLADGSLDEGDVVSTNFAGTGLTARVTYMGGDGNDMALVIDGPLAVTLDGITVVDRVDGTNSIRILNATNTPANLTSALNGTFTGFTVIDTRPIDSVNTDGIQVTGGTTDDILVVDLEGFNDAALTNFTGTISFDGAGQTSGDDLYLNDPAVGGATTYDTVNHTFIDANSGNVVIDRDSGATFDPFTVSYSNIEPIIQNVTATNVTLDYSTGSDDVTLVDLGTQLEASAATAETLTFTAPTATLTINGGDGNDTLNIGSSVDADTVLSNLSAALTVDGQADSDSININDDVLVNSLTLTAEDINLNTGAINSVAGQTYNGPVDVIVSAVITANGDVTFNDAIAMSNDLTVNASASNIVLNGAVDGGSNLVLNTTGVTDINQAIGGATAVTSLTTNADGITELGANVTASGGTLDFNDNVTLTASVTLVNTVGLDFAGTVDGPFDLTLDIDGVTTFNGNVGSGTALGDGAGAALIVNSSGTTEFVGTVTSSQGITQADGAGTVTFRENVNVTGGNVGVQFDANVVLDGLTFDVDGANQSLTFGNATGDLLTTSGSLVTIDTTTDDSQVSINALTVTDDLTVNAGAGTIQIAGGIQGSKDLSLDTTGIVNVTGDVFSSNPLNTFTVTSAAQVDLQDVITNGSIAVTGTNIDLNNDTYFSDTGNVTFTGNVDLDASTSQLNVTSGGSGAVAITFTGAINDTGNDDNLRLIGGLGVVDLQGDAGVANAIGTFTVVSASQVDLQDVISAGAMSVTGTDIDLNDGIYTSNTAGVSYIGAVDLDSPTTVSVSSSGGGAISFSSTIDGAQTLNLDAGSAGNITLDGDAGSATALTALNVTDGAVQSYQGITAGDLTISDATTSVTFNAPTNITNNVSVTSGGTIVLDGKMTAGGTLLFDAMGNIAINTAIDPTTVTLESDTDVNVNAAVQASDTITVSAGVDGTGNANINVGGSLTTTNAGSDISVTSGVTTGAITLNGVVSAMDRVTLTSNGTGNITQSSGALTAANLQINAVGSTTIALAANDVDTIAASTTGAIEFVDMDDLITGTVVSTGINSNGSDVTLCAGEHTLAESISVGLSGATLRLSASTGAISQTGAAISATTLGVRAGTNIDLTSATNAVVEFAADAGGSVSFSNTADYTLTTVSTLGCFTAVTGITAGGDIELCNSTGDLDVGAAINAGTNTVRLQTGGGNITQSAAITAANLGARATGSIQLDFVPNAITGSFSAHAGGFVEFDNTGTFAVGSVTGGACFIATNGVTSAASNVELQTITSGDTTLTDTTNAATTVTINSAAKINGAGLVTAATVDMDATTGIGDTTAVNLATPDVSADSTSGNVDVNNNLAAAAVATSLSTGTGSIVFDQTGGGTASISSATTTNGNITLTNTGADLTLTSVNAGGGGNDVSATTTTSGNIVAGNVTAVDEVTLTSAGTILDAAGNDETTDITATTLTVANSNGIGVSAADALNIAVGNLTVTTTGGNAFFTEANGVNLQTINVAANDLRIDAITGDINNGVSNVTANDLTLIARGNGAAIGGNASAINTTLSGNLTAAATDGAGGIFVSQTGALSINNVDAATGNVGLTSTVSMTSATPDGTADVIGATVGLDVTGVGSDIGTSAASRLDINATTLNASTGGAAGDDIFIEDTAGGLAVGLVTAGSGNVDLLVTGGSLTSAAGDTNVADIVGSDITLEVTGAGSTIGVSVADPLEIDAGANTINAKTSGGTNDHIFLKDTAGGVGVGTVDSGAANTHLVSAAGNINDSTSNVTANDLTLITQSAGDSIGSSTNNISVTLSGVLNAQTAGPGAMPANIFITETGDMLVGLVQSLGGTVELTANGGSLTSNSVDGTADVVGRIVNLQVSGSGNDIGTSSASRLEINAVELSASTAGAVGDDIFIDDRNGGVAANSVNAGAGDVHLRTTGGSLTSLNVNNAADIVGATLNLDATGLGSKLGTNAGSRLEIDATTRLNATGNDIFIDDLAGDLNLGTINAGGAIADLLASAGSITNGASDIVAGDLTLTVSTNGASIGTLASRVNTRAGVLNAFASTGAGGIFVDQTTGNVQLGTVDAGTGDVDISASNDVSTTASEDVTGANINLTLAEDALLTVDSATSITATGNTTLISDKMQFDSSTTNSIGAGTAGTLLIRAAENGTILRLGQGAGNDSDLGAGILALSATEVARLNNTSGNIQFGTADFRSATTIVNDGSTLTLNAPLSFFATTFDFASNNDALSTDSTVNIDATGSISDANGTDTSADIIATTLTITQATTIGSSGNSLNTSIDKLVINSSDGDAFLFELNGVDLGIVNITSDNDLRIETKAGNIGSDASAVNANNATFKADAADAAIGTSAAPINVTLDGTLTASTANGGGGIFVSETGNMSIANIAADLGEAALTAIGGSITSQTVDTVADITANTISLLVSGGGNDIGASAASRLELDATILNGTTDGSVGEDIFILDTAGGVAAGLINSGQGDVFLKAENGSITSEVSDPGVSDIVGDNINLEVTGNGNDLGTSPTDRLEINAGPNTLEAKTEGTVGSDMFLDELDGLGLAGLNAGFGDIFLRSSGSITNGASLITSTNLDIVSTGLDASVGSAASPINATVTGQAGPGMLTGGSPNGTGEFAVAQTSGDLNTGNIDGGTGDLMVSTPGDLDVQGNLDVRGNGTIKGMAGGNVTIASTAQAQSGTGIVKTPTPDLELLPAPDVLSTLRILEVLGFFGTAGEENLTITIQTAPDPDGATNPKTTPAANAGDEVASTLDNGDPVETVFTINIGASTDANGRAFFDVFHQFSQLFVNPGTSPAADLLTLVTATNDPNITFSSGGNDLSSITLTAVSRVAGQGFGGDVALPPPPERAEIVVDQDNTFVIIRINNTLLQTAQIEDSRPRADDIIEEEARLKLVRVAPGEGEPIVRVGAEGEEATGYDLPDEALESPTALFKLLAEKNIPNGRYRVYLDGRLMLEFEKNNNSFSEVTDREQGRGSNPTEHKEATTPPVNDGTQTNQSGNESIMADVEPARDSIGDDSNDTQTTTVAVGVSAAALAAARWRGRVDEAMAKAAPGSFSRSARLVRRAKRNAMK